MPDQIQETRVPVLTLWATMAAEWLQCGPDPAATLGSGVAGSSEPVTARTTGVEGGELSQQVGPSASAMRRQAVVLEGGWGEAKAMSGSEDEFSGRSNTSIGD